MLGKQEKAVTIAWFLTCGCLSTAWCWSSAFALGPTYDEPFYVRAGLKNWHEMNHRELLTQGTMPLPAEVQTFLLFVAEKVLAVDPPNDLATWLPIARLGTTVFWWILLWSSYRLASFYGGTWSGRFAVGMLACEPIFLGHASLATTDLAFTACLLGLIAAFRVRRVEPTGWSRLAAPMLWCMLTILSKASALVFIPVCLGMIELERLWQTGWRPGRTPETWRPPLGSMRDLLLIGVGGLALVFVVCPRASRGLLFQIRHNLDGHGGAFLLGETSPNGFWYYFPATLAIKLGLPLFVLLVVLLAVRPRYLVNGAMLAAFGLLALTPAFRVQLGVRLVLPIAALLLVGAAAALGRWWEEEGTWPPRVLRSGFGAALLIWSTINAVQVWPNGTCYTNELWGGTRLGYQALHDSNYDWGQGLKELADWQRRHPEEPLSVCYFGTDPSLPHLPIRAVSFQEIATLSGARAISGGGFLAVSTNFCAVVPPAHYLRTLEAYDRTTTFFIFDFRPSNPCID